MINITLDGIWCKKCQEMHPTLFWHEKYNDYELNRKEKWENDIKKHFPNYNIEYIDSLPIKNLKEENVEQECIICNTKTFFKHTLTNNFVCSDECKYKDKEENYGERHTFTD